MFRDGLLDGKVVVVTGGGTGLGKAMATRFAELGAKLVLVSRSRAHLDPTAEELRQKGADVLVVPCDIRVFTEVEAMVKETVARFGKLDVLVNNAAGNFLQQTEKLSPNAFKTVVDIVLNGSFHATLACGRQMIAQGTGGNILSIVATYALHSGSAYVVPSACAKAGVLAMTRSLAVEWARHKIRLNAIAPGPFPTEGAWQRLVPPQLTEMAGHFLDKKIPAGRYGEHPELANLAAYLVADESGYVTGECVVIDGGESLMGGEFNGFIGFDQTALGQMLELMRPPKK